MEPRYYEARKCREKWSSISWGIHSVLKNGLTSFFSNNVSVPNRQKRNKRKHESRVGPKHADDADGADDAGDAYM